MILQFNKLILHNFASYADSEIDLSDKGFCAVIGKNNYKYDSALSNGSGKSMMWSALCFALTGETIAGTKSNLKNTEIEDNSCWVTVEFKADNDDYIITRHHKPKSDMKIFKNGADVSGKGIKESEVKLAELLPDLSKNLIASTIIIGQGMPNKFSSFSPSGRKELLEKLTKSDFMIEDVKTKLANRTLEINKQLQEFTTSIAVQHSELTNQKNNLAQINQTLDNFIKPDYDKLIMDANESLQFALNQQDAVNRDIARLEAEFDKYNRLFLQETNNKAAAYNALNEKYRLATDELNTKKLSTEININNLKLEINKLKNIKDVCPTCGQKLPNVILQDTSKQEAELDKLNTELSELIKSKSDYDIKFNSYKNDIEAAFKDTIANINTELSSIKSALASARILLSNANQTINNENIAIARLKVEKDSFDEKFKSLTNAKEATEKEIARLTNLSELTLQGKTELDEHFAVLRKMDSLVKRDFRGYLLADIISYVNMKAKEYCQIVFGTTDLDLSIDGNNLDIMYRGKMFDNLSGGEKQRCDLILQFAIRDLLQTYLNYSSNIIVLDEIFDNLDKVATDRILALITNKLKDIESIFIISHHADELEIPMDTEIKIIKNENGISEVY